MKCLVSKLLAVFMVGSGILLTTAGLQKFGIDLFPTDEDDDMTDGTL